MRERLLVRLFLQRFLDHDLISAETDRREALATIVGMLVALSLFLAVLLAVKYQFNMFLPPGLTAIFSLDDRFLLVTASMLVMALIAVAQWDSLALDARDGAVLGVLPVPQTVIVRAKCVAVALWAAGFVAAWTIAPTLLRPAALPVKLPIGGTGVIALVLAHAVTSIGAGALGFFAVLALRESLRAVLGQAVFRRVSPGLQASLVIACATGLLLLPGVYSGVGRDWLSQGRLSPLAVPSLWFVGLHESLAGWVFDELPRGNVPRFFASTEREATTLYRALWPLFRELGGIAIASLVATTALAAIVSLWNGRRFPVPAGLRVPRERTYRRLCAWLVTRVIARQPPVQAGFFFALQTVSRKASHRLTLASALAIGLALVVVSADAQMFAAAGATSTVPLAALAAQTILLAALTAGFRHAVRVPAELRANWTFKMCCTGTMRPYISGVMKAGWFGLILPTLTVISAIDAAVLGAWLAFLQFTLGVVVSRLLLEIAFLGYNRLPFASAYVPGAHLSVTSIVIPAVVLAAFSLAWVERAAIESLTAFGALLAVLASLATAVRKANASWRQPTDLPDLDESAALPTQRLTLAG